MTEQDAREALRERLAGLECEECGHPVRWHGNLACVDRSCPCRQTHADALLPAVEEYAAEQVIEFAQWVATNRAYNGSIHHHGQSLYNECLNAVLPTWAADYARAALDGSPAGSGGEEAGR